MAAWASAFALHLKMRLRPHGKRCFIHAVRCGGRILDVGCGNGSPSFVKAQRPDLNYHGLDVVDDPLAGANVADHLVVAAADEFADAICRFDTFFDAVICAHNIEHCADPGKVLHNMMVSLAPAGMLYLSFPSQASVAFPRRAGTLNFHDDRSHRSLPDFESILRALARGGCEVVYAARRYRPAAMALIGLLAEPYSAWRRQVVRGTWELYGFESVIWARKSPP